MSRPRSRSPHYRRFPWEEPDFDPHKVLAVLDGNPSGRSHRLRQDPEENWDYFREDSYPEGQRRSSPFSDERPFERRCHPDEDEFYRRRPSPRYEPMGFDNRRHSPPRNVGGDGERHRAGFREHFHGFENKGRSSHTPPGLVRERLPPMPRSHSDQPGTGWRDEQDRGRGRFREVSPSERTDEQRGGAGRERGRRNEHEHNRRRDVPHQERNPLSKRQRREMDDSSHLGYRNEEDFGEQRYSKDSPRGGFGGNFHGDARRLRPLIIEHDHGISEGRKPPHWEKFNDHRDPGVDFNRQRSPRPGGSSSQDRFRTEEREDARGRNFQDKWRESNFIETRRSPVQPDRPNLMRFGNRDGSVNLRGRGGGGVRSARGRLKRGRTGPLRNEARLQQTSLGFKDPPHGEQQPGYRPFREDRYEDPVEGETSWSGEERLQQWERERPRSLEQRPARVDLDPKMPRQRERGWIDQKSSNTSTAKDETLTIKVDMKRPVNHNSSLCYSSDRQLSLDLVNVGRQRLDFLPMLEHSGTYREMAVHTGTFAQEIITLVHHVKEQYFRDDGVTLNERFSAPQKGGFTEEETEELTLDERFSSNRGFTLNMNSLLEEEEEEPLFSRLGPKQSLNQQPVRGPGDLRHDLERRRQERLEGVKVTIPGNTSSQLPHGSVSESGFDYDDEKDEMVQMDDVEFTTWSDEPSRRREGINSALRRGAAFRLNSGVQRRNHRLGERGGPMRRQNNRSNAAAAAAAESINRVRRVKDVSMETGSKVRGRGVRDESRREEVETPPPCSPP